jgi:hypothetical protein
VWRAASEILIQRMELTSTLMITLILIRDLFPGFFKRSARTGSNASFSRQRQTLQIHSLIILERTEKIVTFDFHRLPARSCTSVLYLSHQSSDSCLHHLRQGDCKVTQSTEFLSRQFSHFRQDDASLLPFRTSSGVDHDP